MKIKEVIVPKTAQTLKVKSKILIRVILGKCPTNKTTIKMIKNNQELITIMNLINNQNLKTKPINPCKLLH